MEHNYKHEKDLKVYYNKKILCNEFEKLGEKDKFLEKQRIPCQN